MSDLFFNIRRGLSSSRRILAFVVCAILACTVFVVDQAWLHKAFMERRVLHRETPTLFAHAVTEHCASLKNVVERGDNGRGYVDWLHFDTLPEYRIRFAQTLDNRSAPLYSGCYGSWLGVTLAYASNMALHAHISGCAFSHVMHGCALMEARRNMIPKQALESGSHTGHWWQFYLASNFDHDVVCQKEEVSTADGNKTRTCRAGCLNNIEPGSHDKALLRGQVMRHIFKPHPWVRSEASCRVARLGLEKKEYIAFHIRRGDKVRGNHAEGEMIDLSEFMNVALVVRSRTNISKLAIVADEDETISEALEEASKHNFEVVYDKTEIRRGGPYKADEEDFVEQIFDEVITGFKNLGILANSHTLVGSRSSFFFMVAEALQNFESTVPLGSSGNLKFPQEWP